MQPIYVGKKSSATIRASDYAKWYTISEKAAGKPIKVKKPANSSFALYDENGICVNFTVISGSHKVLLPEQGSIVFAEEAGSKGEIVIEYKSLSG